MSQIVAILVFTAIAQLAYFDYSEKKQAKRRTELLRYASADVLERLMERDQAAKRDSAYIDYLTKSPALRLVADYLNEVLAPYRRLYVVGIYSGIALLNVVLEIAILAVLAGWTAPSSDSDLVALFLWSVGVSLAILVLLPVATSMWRTYELFRDTRRFLTRLDGATESRPAAAEQSDRS